MARPTKMTPDVIQKLEYAFAIGSSDEEACFYADIAKQTLYNYQKEHPEFLDRKEALKQRPIFEARETVVKHVKRDPRLAMDYLSRKKKDEFSTKTETDLSVKELPTPILGGQSVSRDDSDSQATEA